LTRGISPLNVLIELLIKGIIMETKFLSDGRKVAIIGQLNQTEYIVQEIFVTEQGDEIPSGERFTTKGLHETPVQSYADRQIKKKEETLNRIKSSISEIERQEKIEKNRLQSLRDQMKSANRLSGKLDSFDWDLFCDIATGGIKYIVNSDYYWYKPQRVDTSDYHFSKYDGRYEGLRMISLVFHGEKDHSYNIFNYRDGSGAISKIDVMRTDEELKEWLKDRAEKEHSEGRLRLEQLSFIELYIDVRRYREELKEYALKEVQDTYDKSVEYAESTRNKKLTQLGLSDAS